MVQVSVSEAAAQVWLYIEEQEQLRQERQRASAQAATTQTGPKKPFRSQRQWIARPWDSQVRFSGRLSLPQAPAPFAYLLRTLLFYCVCVPDTALEQ
jgi:hypothetical protein